VCYCDSNGLRTAWFSIAIRFKSKRIDSKRVIIVWTMILSMPEATTSSAHNDKCKSALYIEQEELPPIQRYSICTFVATEVLPTIMLVEHNMR
jgi:hypothetical protein